MRMMLMSWQRVKYVAMAAKMITDSARIRLIFLVRICSVFVIFYHYLELLYVKVMCVIPDTDK